MHPTSAYLRLALLIDGEWIGPEHRDTQPVTNPASDAVLGPLPLATAADLEAALQAAERAFAAWRARGPRQRAVILKGAADLLRQRVDAIAGVMTLEQGKPLAEARGEVLVSADVLEWSAEEGRRTYGRIVPAPSPGLRQMVVSEPLGVAVAMTPWNFPALTPARKIGGALAAGCTLVLKAAEETPGTAVALAQALQDAGLPAGVLNLVFGDPSQISEHLIGSPIARKVSFTGSVAVGKRLMRLAADGLKRTTMELGGHAPVVICDDVDPRRAAAVLAAGKFRNAGQVCISPTRFYVQNGVFDAFSAAFCDAARQLVVGDGTQSNVTMGPLTHRRRVEAMVGFVQNAEDRGGVVLTGGGRIDNVGSFFEPTVISDLPDDARLMREEPFGPLAPLARFTDLDEVIVRANALPVGLAAYAFTRDNARAMALASQLKAGMVGINTLAVSTPETPFGGVGESGHGQEGGVEGLQAYMDVKFVAHAADV